MSIVLLGIWAMFSGYGAWIASIKRRSLGEGLALGLFLGPVGCVVEASLRERTVEEVDEERIRRQDEAQVRLEEEVRAEVSRTRRAEAFGRFSSWFDRFILNFGWYRALPEVVQPIVIGLSVALPIVAVLIYFFRGR
jgi:hypothetical protein